MDEPFDPDKSGTWKVPRTDNATRAVINHVDTVRDGLIELRAVAVTWPKLIAILGSAATIIVSASWKVMRDNLERSDKVHAVEMRAIRDEVQGLRPYVVGSFQAGVENKPKARVAEEVRAAVADGGVP